MKKAKMTKFIEGVLESESELELTLNNCNVFIHTDFGLNHRWLLTDFKQMKELVVILLTLSRMKILVVILLLIVGYGCFLDIGLQF